MVGPLIANCGSLDSTLPDDLEPDRCQDWIDGGVDGTALGGRQQELGHPGKNADIRLGPDLGEA